MDIEKIENGTDNNELEVKKFLYSNEKLRKQISEHLNMVEANKKLIIENEKKIWKKCNHHWERDYNVAFDDRIKYYCSKCNLWRNEYMYS